MFEKPHQPLLPQAHFILRVLRNFLFALVIIGISLFMGMWGYRHFEHLDWIDAYVNAAMLLSGMGPLHNPVTYGGKIFAGTYALFSGILFLFIMGVIFSPIVHRLFHIFLLKKGE
ncbi:MAG: hypothetical protein WC222_09580 [Parachlamydiales bacterium]|jgi:hypothetical protein